MPSYNCKGCTERYVGCHGKCEIYKSQQKANDERLAEKAKRARETSVLYGFKRPSKSRRESNKWLNKGKKM